MRRIISSLLIIIGIILILSPFINNQIIKYSSRKVVIEELTIEEIEENINRPAVYDFSSIKDVDISTTIFSSPKLDNKYVIGQIIIEDLDINLPVMKGVNNSNLLMGASTMVEGMEMGKGNYSLAGHNMKNKDLLFGSLMDIELDTIVKMTDKKNIYEYKIYDIEVVEDTAFYMLEDKKAEERGKPIISLMTCYYSSKTGKRFFALGELIDEYPYEIGIEE